MATKSTPTATSSWMDIIFGLYLAVVNAVALLVLVILVGSFVNSALDIAFPRPLALEKVAYDTPDGKVRPLSVEEATTRRAEQQAQQENEALRSLVHDSVYLLLTGAIFGVHWRLFRSRLSPAKAPKATR